MGSLDPIAGISLERYAELCAKMKDCGGDLEVCARIAAENGVARADWEAAMNGWNARMQDPATAGKSPSLTCRFIRRPSPPMAAPWRQLPMKTILRCLR